MEMPVRKLLNWCVFSSLVAFAGCHVPVPAAKEFASEHAAAQTGADVNQDGQVLVDAAEVATVADSAVDQAAAGPCSEALGCDDTNPCTDDTCDAGVCKHVAAPSGKSCDDGNKCTENGKCQSEAAGSQCVGTAKTCDDANPCTDDSCDPASGCKPHVNNLASCDDGDACTDSDKCAEGVCKGGQSKDCDDKNPCTADSCTKDQGCIHSNVAGTCNDPAQVCTNGQCSSLPQCGNGDCSTAQGETPNNCKADCSGHYCDTHCKEVNPENGCSCVQGSSNSCNADGSAPVGKQYGCGMSTTCSCHSTNY
jgi:hypothetical protein